MERSPAADASPTTTSERGLPGAGRVLVVEDEPLIRDTLEVLIQIEGCEVRSAPDAAQALALLDGWTPDLILLDYTLPGMSGHEFIQAYHQTPGPHAPIILLTARTLDPSDVSAMGADGMLPKPFELTDLLDVVARFADCGGD